MSGFIALLWKMIKQSFMYADITAGAVE